MCVTAGICACAVQCELRFFLQHRGNLIIKHTTAMSPAIIYPAVCANCYYFFLNVECAISSLGLWWLESVTACKDVGTNSR